MIYFLVCWLSGQGRAISLAAGEWLQTQVEFEGLVLAVGGDESYSDVFVWRQARRAACCKVGR